MLRYTILLFTLFFCNSIAAQDSSFKATIPSNSSYLGYYIMEITPPKLDSAIKRVKKIVPETQEAATSTNLLSKQQINHLHEEEKFLYYLYYGDHLAQFCSLTIYSVHYNTAIWGRLPRLDMSRLWSDEQIAYFQQHRDSAIQYLQALLPTSYFGHNAQKLTILLQANELIPTIIERYHVTKSKELLSITLQLMLQHNFLQQVAPKLYKTLYENESITRPNYLVYNDKNVQQVITLARQFYTNYPK